VSLERAVSGFLNLVRLHQIKSEIIVFSLLATLIPSLGMGWLSYRNNRRVLESKITQELQSLTSHASRGLDLWFREREYEIRVFAASYEVSENLAKIRSAARAARGADTPLDRLQTYLGSVKQRFAVYEELLVLDLAGNKVATSATGGGRVSLPADWLAQVAAGQAALGEPYRDDALGAGVIPIAAPVRDARDVVLGVLVAKLDVGAIGELLSTYEPGGEHELYVTNEDGVLLAGARPLPGAFMSVQLESEAARALRERERVPREFTSPRGNAVVGVLESASRLGWGVVAEKDRARAYAEITGLRNATLLLVSTILVIIGLTAYLLGVAIVRPLHRLTAAAARIASGNLDVYLPVLSRGELGLMTEVFNHMAGRLRELLGELDATNQALRDKNEELHHLSITDPLTGLFNRKHMTEAVATEAARAARHARSFSILMIDIDHFKKYNDTYGHPEGDRVLTEAAAAIRGALRAGDYAARYGGEEFLVLLPDTALADAPQTAERIRKQVEEKRLGAGGSVVTVSIGVASFPENGDDPEEVINQADAAMYLAKRVGRNRVEVARGRREPRSRKTG
jgi:diguanylate cyclase (GGDEF)-like protein